MNEIEKYFPELTARQREQFGAMREVYAEWNARINVISRKDFDAFYLHHVLHSLAIARVCRFDAGARVVDGGGGGGFPSVPLAIMFPQAHFTAVDSIRKKITVVEGVRSALGIGNLTAVNGRAEQLGERFDYAVSRAVAGMPELVRWIWNKIEPGQRGSLPSGMICLKGGDLDAELAASRLEWRRFPISEIFAEEYFETKLVLYAQKI